MSRLIFKVRRPYKPFESARADVGNFYHRSRRRVRIVKKYKNWARKYLKKNRYFPRPWYGKNSVERVQNIESKSPIRRRKLSPRAKHARKFTRMRYHFHNTHPRSFYRTAHKAFMLGKQATGSHNSLANLLEGRVDSILYRSNFIRTKRFMRQIIRCDNVCVDGKIINKPYHVAKLGQIITVLINPKDSKYRISSRHGILIKHNKIAKRRKKIIRQIKRYRKKTKKTYKKKHFLFLLKGVFDKNWIYRKKATLKKLRLLVNYVKFKKKYCKHTWQRRLRFKKKHAQIPHKYLQNIKEYANLYKFHKKIIVVLNFKSKTYSTETKAKKMDFAKEKKLIIFRLKFIRLVIQLRNLMRIKRFVRISQLYTRRKNAKIDGIIFTRHVLGRLGRRKLFSKRQKKRRFFVIAFHEFKRMRIKRAEISRYFFKINKVASKRRNRFYITKFFTPHWQKIKKCHTHFPKKILKGIKLNFKLQHNLKSMDISLQTKFIDKKLTSHSCKILFKKIRTFRIRRLAYLRNLCLYQFYFLLVKNTVAAFFAHRKKLGKNFSGCAYNVLFRFFFRFKKKVNNRFYPHYKKQKSKYKNITN